MGFPLLPGVVLVLLPRRWNPACRASRGPEHLPTTTTTTCCTTMARPDPWDMRPEHTKAFFVSPFIQLEDVRYRFASRARRDAVRGNAELRRRVADADDGPRARGTADHRPSALSCRVAHGTHLRTRSRVDPLAGADTASEAGRFIRTHGTTQRGDVVLEMKTPIEHLIEAVLTRGLRAGELTLVGRGGTERHFVGPEPGPHATVIVNSAAAARRVALRNSVGLAQGYMDGRLGHRRPWTPSWTWGLANLYSEPSKPSSVRPRDQDLAPASRQRRDGQPQKHRVPLRLG